MKTRRVITMIAMAALLGLVVAVPLGENQRISVEIWLGAFAAWLAWLVARQIFSAAPARPTRLRLAWQWPQQSKRVRDKRPRPLHEWEGLILSARDNKRAMALRLRPRLRSMSDHYLRTRHGVDPESEPARAMTILDRVTWLVDPEAEARTPELNELDHLLDLLLTEQQSGAHTHE